MRRWNSAVRLRFPAASSPRGVCSVLTGGCSCRNSSDVMDKKKIKKKINGEQKIRVGVQRLKGAQKQHTNQNARLEYRLIASLERRLGRLTLSSSSFSLLAFLIRWSGSNLILVRSGLWQCLENITPAVQRSLRCPLSSSRPFCGHSWSVVEPFAPLLLSPSFPLGTFLLTLFSSWHPHCSFLSAVSCAYRSKLSKCRFFRCPCWSWCWTPVCFTASGINGPPSYCMCMFLVPSQPTLPFFFLFFDYLVKHIETHLLK